MDKTKPTKTVEMILSITDAAQKAVDRFNNVFKDFPFRAVVKNTEPYKMTVELQFFEEYVCPSTLYYEQGVLMGMYISASYK